MPDHLSKSRIIAWRQCPKRLWLQVHRPELIEVTAADEQRFKAGHEVGQIARHLFLDGILVEEADLAAALQTTQAILANHRGRPIFEATFRRDGVLAQVDVLIPEKKGHRMLEVKSSTEVKDYHLEDCAIQAWVAGGSCDLVGVEVVHVDNQFVYPGNGDYRGLLTQVPVLEAITVLTDEVPAWVDAARATLGSGEPDIFPGEHCSTPFNCPFTSYCRAGMVEAEYPLSALPRLSASKRQALKDMRIEDIRDIPDTFGLTRAQARVRAVTRAGRAELSSAAAGELAGFTYPRYYLDFETVAMVVPYWTGTRPYQAIPVQWSCHIETAPGATTHHAFLAKGATDPRPAFAQTLIDALGDHGPVFVYNSAFELRILRELIQDYPTLAPALHAVAERVVDLLPITREHYYHPDMRGSWSIKAVLPTIASDLSYDGLEIGDGDQAQVAWREIILPDTPAERRQTLHDALASYCALDTWAMVRLAWFLQGIESTDFTNSPRL